MTRPSLVAGSRSPMSFGLKKKNSSHWNKGLVKCAVQSNLKKSLWPIKTGKDNLINQLVFDGAKRGKTCASGSRLPLVFTSDWLRKWRVIF